MKRMFKILFSILFVFLLVSCKSIYRTYNDDALENLVKEDFGFSEMLFFKIVDSDTAKELTGKSYNLSGVIVGISEGKHIMVFIPKKVSEEPFLIDNTFEFNISNIYKDLRLLKDDQDHFLFDDLSSDYGGLSLDVEPYEAFKNANIGLTFDSKVFFVITTDKTVFYVGFVDNDHVIFNITYKRIK